MFQWGLVVVVLWNWNLQHSAEAWTSQTDPWSCWSCRRIVWILHCCLRMKLVNENFSVWRWWSDWICCSSFLPGSSDDSWIITSFCFIRLQSNCWLLFLSAVVHWSDQLASFTDVLVTGYFSVWSDRRTVMVCNSTKMFLKWWRQVTDPVSISKPLTQPTNQPPHPLTQPSKLTN